MWPYDDTDQFGNPICAQSFMAGTICTLPPDHGAGCKPICQNCGFDWYLGECTCGDAHEDAKEVEKEEELAIKEDLQSGEKKVQWM